MTVPRRVVRVEARLLPSPAATRLQRLRPPPQQLEGSAFPPLPPPPVWEYRLTVDSQPPFDQRW